MREWRRELTAPPRKSANDNLTAEAELRRTRALILLRATCAACAKDCANAGGIESRLSALLPP
jgi:hypothetical protein